MTESLTTSKTLVIDANIAIAVVVPAPLTVVARDLLRQWLENDVTIVAPTLWLAETASVIRRYVHAKQMTPQEGSNALDNLLALSISIVPDDQIACRNAYRWSSLLGQIRAYDGFYLALAESMNAPLFSADRRLVNRGQQLGLTWIHWAGGPHGD